MSGTNVRSIHAQRTWVRHTLVNGKWAQEKEASTAASVLQEESRRSDAGTAAAPPQGPPRRRSGYRPEGWPVLSPTERLTDAAMSLLRRDAAMVERVDRLVKERPACLPADFATRLAAAHAEEHAGVHAAGDCRAWLRSVVALCRDVGWPSLGAMLLQLGAVRDGLPFGSWVYRGIRADPPEAGPRRAFGQIDSPARLLLARRWHRPGRTWEDVSEQLGLAVGDWIEGTIPERSHETYPAWHEWAGLPRSRAIRGQPAIDEALSVLAEGTARGRRSPAAASGTGDTLRKGVAKIERILAANLPAVANGVRSSAG